MASGIFCVTLPLINLNLYHMIKVLFTGLMALSALSVAADTKTVTSPDGKVAVSVSAENGQAFYTVDYDGKPMLTRSALGLNTSYGDFTKELTLANASEKNVDVNYELSRSKVAKVAHKAKELTVAFTNAKTDTMKVVFHVSDNAVAYRYTLVRPKRNNPKTAIIYNEASAFNFPEYTTTFLTPQSVPMVGFERTKPSYEEEYHADQPLKQKSAFGQGYTFPCLFKVGADGWVLVSETGTNSNYPGCRLTDYEEGKGYTVNFPQEGENNGYGPVTASVPVPFDTPWRTIALGKTLKPVVETTIQYDVVEPLYEASQVYEPGRYTWSWLIWQDGSTIYEDQVKFIDVAAEMGYEYILVDALWDTQIGYDRIEQLAQYAKGKGVSLLLWYNSNGHANDAPQGPRGIMGNTIERKKAMAWMKRVGVKGIKVDFFGGDKQETMKLYEDILSDANDYGIQVIFHGCTLPRGWERMYPNYVGSEAALASENVFFSEYHAKKEGFEMNMYPYTRNVVGSFDWGGVIMNRFLSKDNKSRHRRYTTDAFELATAVTNQCSVNCVALTPNALEVQSEEMKAELKALPTVWSEMSFIDGYPGKYTVIARKCAETGKWYVGGINATEEALTLKLQLPMLAGQEVSLVGDDKKGEPTFKKVKVGKDGKLKVTMQSQGGVYIHQ